MEYLCEQCKHTINWHSSDGCHDDLPNDTRCGCKQTPHDILQAQLTALQTAAGEVVAKTHGVNDASVPDSFQAHLTIGDVRALAALVTGAERE